VSQPSGSVTPYRIVYSGRYRTATTQLLLRARAKGRFAEIAQLFRDIETRLKWVPLDVGQLLRDYPSLGLQELVLVLAPLVVTYSVDEVRRLVYLSVPFKLLPNSGLEP
jgi:hypothetical protein